jgi:hypothetical protein
MSIHEDETGRRMAMERLTKDEARSYKRIAPGQTGTGAKSLSSVRCSDVPIQAEGSCQRAALVSRQR